MISKALPFQSGTKNYRVSLRVYPLLVLAGLASHVVAFWRMERHHRVFPYMDPVTVHHIPMIDAVQDHFYFAVLFGVTCFGLLFWLEWRKASRWVVWACFSVVAVLALDYIWGCLALGTRFAIYNP